MKKIEMTPVFIKNWKALRKKHYDKSKLDKVIELLAKEEGLPGKYKDHSLSGNWKGFRECHIQDNWLLIYLYDETRLVLTATGTHDDLFK